MSAVLRRVVTSAGLADLWEPAERGARIERADLERLLGTSPLAAAALADVRRAAAAGVVVRHPWTLRVRAPGMPRRAARGDVVSHAVDALERIPATEAELVGVLPANARLGHAVEMVRSVAVARPDLTLRALTAETVQRLADEDGSSVPEALRLLAAAGLHTLDWSASLDPVVAAVHRAAHEAGMLTVAPLGYRQGALDATLLDRLEALRGVAEATSGFLSVVCVPETGVGGDPLGGTAGTEDTLVCALARLALGHTVPHVTVDAHVVGHKLAGFLFSAGASDVVGAQAAERWAPPTDDGPRPLNPDRMRRCIIEAKRSPELRDALFRDVEATTGA